MRELLFCECQSRSASYTDLSQTLAKLKKKLPERGLVLYCLFEQETEERGVVFNFFFVLITGEAELVFVW